MIGVEQIVREAGFFLTTEMKDDPRFAMFERAFAIYREALVQELIAGSGEPAVKLNGKKNGKLSEEQMELYTADQLAGAVLRERERCAKVCEFGASAMAHKYMREAASRCAAAIRSGE